MVCCPCFKASALAPERADPPDLPRNPVEIRKRSFLLRCFSQRHCQKTAKFQMEYCRGGVLDEPEVLSNTDELKIRHLADISSEAEKRQVFLSHTGQDGSKEFAASLLPSALGQVGVSHFVDYVSLKTGTDWPQELVDGATNSAVMVVVLTKAYTERFWCMLELDLALWSRHYAGRAGPRIIPVLWESEKEVQPDAVERYWQEWLQQPNVDKDRAPWVNPERWADNIRRVFQLQGPRRRDPEPKGEWARLAEEVATTALGFLPKFVEVDEGVIGTDAQKEKLLEKLRICEEPTGGLWLYAPGGSGKTTLARLLYNELSPSFRHSAYVELDFTDSSQQDLRKDLQALLWGLGAGRHEGTVPGLSNQLRNYVAGKKVLLVIDNVSTGNQLKSLLPVELGPGSRIIITSRNKSMEASETWEQVNALLLTHGVQLLDNATSRQLFLSRAGLGSVPRHLEGTATEIIELCSGLPLALRIAGAALRRKTEERAWKAVQSALEIKARVFKEIGFDTENRLCGIISHSLADLGVEAVNMFLDVATVMAGESKDIAVPVWTAWHWGIDATFHLDSLEERCLVTTDSAGCLGMHPVLAALAHNIILDQHHNMTSDGLQGKHYGSRVWVNKAGRAESVRQGVVLAAQLDRLAWWLTPAEAPLLPEGVNMSSVRVLRLGSLPTERTGVLVRLHSDLLWLEVYQSLTPGLEESLQKASGLIYLTAHKQKVESRCLDLGRLQSVHMVSLRGSNMCELRGLWQLSKLQVLDLRDCWWLQSLDPAPATSLGSSGPAPELRRIDLTGCSQLRFLPAFVAQLPKLEQLVVKRCSQLLLPGSFNTQLYSSLAAGPLQRQAFISYSTHSEVAARFAVNALRPALEGAGVAVVLSGQVQQLQDKQQQQQLDQELKLQQWPAILADAAANSQVFVAVLDGHYSSSFSIVELDLAVRSHKLAGSQIRPAIVPVFLEAPGHVAPAEPAEVGKWSASEIGELQAEEVAKVWAAHLLAAEQQDSKILRTGAGLEEEGRLAEQVVHQVMQLASRPAQHGLVLGFEDQEEELAGKLQNSSLLGTWLYGQGGLGKTVMARLLVEQLEQRFSHHVFIPVDRQGGNQQLDALLANALSQLGCSSAAAGASSAAELLRDFVRTNDALLVLDNVWTKEQLIVLLPTELAPGSRVIVTSRYHPDELGLSQELGSKMDVRRLEPLAKEAAQTLLRHFTGMAEPPDGTVQLEQQILDACEGLPLALQLAGSFLWRETDVAAWKEVCKQLQAGRHRHRTSQPADTVGTEEHLQPMIDHALSSSLSEPALNMLLDAVSVLLHQDSQLALAVWDAWWRGEARRAFQELRDRSLVSIDEQGRLQVLDVYRSLAQGLLKDSGSEVSSRFHGSRVWVEDGRLIGLKGQGGGQVLAACLDGAAVRELDLQAHNWSDVRILVLGSSKLPPQALHHLFGPAVLWLDLGSAEYNIGDLQQDPKGLVILRASITSQADADLWVFCGNHSSLEMLDLSGSRQLSTLPDTIGQLTALQLLNLSGCRQLSTLPNTIGQLTALQKLDLSGCKQLNTLPKTIGQLIALQFLNLRWCEQLSTLPESIGQLTALQKLDLSSRQLRTLPESFGQLTALQLLNLSGCTQLRTLPESFGQLTGLQKLDLSGCTQLRTLPESFGQLTGLQTARAGPALEHWAAVAGVYTCTNIGGSY